MYLVCRLLLESPATSRSYTLSLHDALPICLDLNRSTVLRVAIYPRSASTRQNDPKQLGRDRFSDVANQIAVERELQSCRLVVLAQTLSRLDRKSTRLNSSHRCTSYAVFCLKARQPLAPTLFPYTTLFRSVLI